LRIHETPPGVCNCFPARISHITRFKT
jgi:hypothetical protein